MAIDGIKGFNPPGAQSATGTPATKDVNDFRQFAELRRNSADPAAIKEVARQFESLFTKMMLTSMRDAGFGDSLFGSDQAEMYQGMADDQLAVQLSQGRGLGLADMLFRQLSQGQVAADEKAAIASTATGPAPNDRIGAATRDAFVAQIRPYAEAAGRELGVDPRAIIAQAALETGWGTSRPADSTGNSHNLFGIKAGAGWRGASVESRTQEYTHGVAGEEHARFRAYGSLAESVADYVRVLRDNPRYSAALDTGGDVQAFANALQRGGYATDPAYAEKLVSVAAKLDLTTVNPFKSAGTTPIANAEPRTEDA